MMMQKMIIILAVFPLLGCAVNRDIVEGFDDDQPPVNQSSPPPNRTSTTCITNLIESQI